MVFRGNPADTFRGLAKWQDYSTFSPESYRSSPSTSLDSERSVRYTGAYPTESPEPSKIGKVLGPVVDAAVSPAGKALGVVAVLAAAFLAVKAIDAKTGDAGGK